jgi:diguanylate cyclase (GGDEF)-like protein/PAS domain S-box-containing protein
MDADALDARLGLTFTHSSTPMCVVDAADVVVATNDSMCELLGRAASDVVGVRWEAWSHVDDAAVEFDLIRAGATPRHELETRVVRADGQDVWCRVIATRLSSASDRCLLVEAVDVTTQHVLAERAKDAEDRANATKTAFQEELRRLAIAATTDQGTGLKNRRGFFALAQHELNVAQRLRHPLTLIFFDLDRLKHINDTFGHLEGDRAIADTAALLAGAFRESDLVARLGGDEFCVLALGPPEAFAQTMRRFETALDEHNRSAARRYRLSLSYGVAFYEPDTEPVTLDELMSRADASMYESKTKRRSA